MEKETDIKKKILFVYDIPDEDYWKDGLYAAVELLKEDFEVHKLNLKNFSRQHVDNAHDFVLGWGGFNSPVDIFIQSRIEGTKKLIDSKQPHSFSKEKYGLCLGGYAPYGGQQYDVIFYETEWSKKWLEGWGVKTKLVHAFGVNTSIYKSYESWDTDKIWDYITVGAFAYWKRQLKIIDKKGTKLAIGEIQKNNMSESIDIFGSLALSGCAISDMVLPETLAKLYNASKICYIPADIFGGGERSVLEARACGIDVEVEQDNPKLQELVKSEIWDQHYYAKQLKEGIKLCLNQSS